jgi:hypothetical protein
MKTLLSSYRDILASMDSCWLFLRKWLVRETISKPEFQLKNCCKWRILRPKTTETSHNNSTIFMSIVQRQDAKYIRQCKNVKTHRLQVWTVKTEKNRRVERRNWYHHKGLTPFQKNPDDHTLKKNRWARRCIWRYCFWAGVWKCQKLWGLSSLFLRAIYTPNGS